MRRVDANLPSLCSVSVSTVTVDASAGMHADVRAGTVVQLPAVISLEGGGSG